MHPYYILLWTYVQKLNYVDVHEFNPTAASALEPHDSAQTSCHSTYVKQVDSVKV